MSKSVTDFLLPGLGASSFVLVCGAMVCWVVYVFNSFARAADALERIADALEGKKKKTEDENDGDED